jgi:hypothetical protein
MTPGILDAIKLQLARQVAHWSIAAAELSDVSRLASSVAWRSLERHLGVALEQTLRQAVNQLAREVHVLQAELVAAETMAQLDRLRGDLHAFRDRYLAVEKVLAFYGHVVNTRTQDRLGAYLRACDVLARRAMASVLEPLGRRLPPVVTYLDDGLGASILKAGLVLWDGRSVSPVAAIKLARHNMLRPTSFLHEVGHAVAHEIGWTDEAGRALADRLSPHGAALAQVWSGWASELVADTFAFAHSGYAAVAALHDVLAGDPRWVMQHVPGDPHPIGYLRILLGRAMCVRFFGAGAWDDLAQAWRHTYPVDDADGSADLVRRSIDVLPEIVELLLCGPLRCLGGRSVQQVIDPGRVKPEALDELERTAGASLFISEDWIVRECLRLVALSGLRAAVAGNVPEALRQQEQWMLRLGRIAAAA